MKKIKDAPELKEMIEKLLCEYAHDSIGGIAERIAAMVSHESLVPQGQLQSALLKFETIRYANMDSFDGDVIETVRYSARVRSHPNQRKVRITVEEIEE